jgi:hypothetical protein
MDTYEVCLSLAGPDREYVAEVARHLGRRAVRYYYDADDPAELWGENLPERLTDIYGSASRFCVMFVSRNYLASSWTLLERRAAVARARRLRGPAYVLPVVLDDTPVPPELGDVAFIDGRRHSPRELGDLICVKLGRAATDGRTGSLEFAWYRPLEFRTHPGTDRVPLYQQIAVAGAMPNLSATVNAVFAALGRHAVRADAGIRWTHHEDRRFDRLYATSTVALSLLQIGVPIDNDIVSAALDFLRDADPGSIDDRAATILRLVIHDLDENAELAFLDALRPMLITDAASPLRGSMVLPQGPVATPAGHWSSVPVHASGASFHACHIGETLLSIPEDHTSARAAATDILAGIREYLVRTLEGNEGYLVDRDFRRTPQTLYAYCVLQGLSAPLPARWRANADELFESTRAAADRRFSQFLQVADAWYLYAFVRDPEFRRTAAVFAQDVLSQISPAEIAAYNVRDLAALLRAIGAAVRLADERLGSIVTAIAVAAMGEWESRASG